MQDLTIASPSWNRSEKIVFRFVFIYIALYLFNFPLAWLRFILNYSVPLIWDAPVVWLGEILFDTRITIRPNGSGDTTWSYLQVLIFCLLVNVGTVIWSVADRKRTNYDRLYFWLIVFVRYYLAMTMIDYGMIKVIKTQFPFPSLERLTSPIGDSSPMGLLWTFMGFSKAYNFFTGMAELLGGILLFFRRTRLIGALVCIGVMSNVTMLNFTYDVPVKLYSLHLLLFAFFLITPDIYRLLNFFVLNKPVSTETLKPLFNGTRWYYPYVVGKALFIAYSTIYLAFAVHENQKKWGDTAPRPTFYGLYEVDKHIVNQDTLPALMNHSERWKTLIVDQQDRIAVKYMDGEIDQYELTTDTSNHKISIHLGGSLTGYNFNYSVKDKTYFLRGTYNKDSIFIELNRKGPNDFLLVNRGFNWINEYPYNR